MSSTRPRVVLARLLLDSGLADMTLLGMATRIAAEGDVSLVHALVRWRLVDSLALGRLLSEGTGMAVTALDTVQGPLPVPTPRVTCARLRIMPLWRRGDLLGLAMADPTDDGAAHEIARSTGLGIERLLVDDDDLDLALRRVYGWASSTAPQPSSLSAPTTPPAAQAPLSSSPPAFAAAPLAPVASPSPSPSPPPPPPPLPTTTTTSPGATPPGPPGAPLNPDELPTLDTGRPATRVPTAAPAVPRLQVTEPPNQEVKLTDVRSELFVDSIVEGISIVDDEPFMSQSSGVFSSNTVDTPVIGESVSAPPTPTPRPAPPPPPSLTPPAAAGRQPTRAPAPMISEATSEFDARMFSAPGPEADLDGRAGADALEAGDDGDDFENVSTSLVDAAEDAPEPSDDKTIPNDNLLFVMRVLLVGDGPAVEGVGAMLRRRVRQFQLVSLVQAGGEVDQRRYDAVVVVDPPDSVTGSWLLAQLAGKARNGIVVVSASTEMARVPGVRTVQTRPPDDQLGDVIIEVLQRRARGD